MEQLSKEEFIRVNIDNYSWKELTKKYNEYFNDNVTSSSIRKRALRNGISKSKEANKERYYTKFGKDIREYILDNSQEFSNTELSNQIKDKFNVVLTKKQIGQFKSDYNRNKRHRALLPYICHYDKVIANKEIIDYLKDNCGKYSKYELIRNTINKFKNNNALSLGVLSRVIKDLGLECPLSYRAKTPEIVKKYIIEKGNDKPDKELAKDIEALYGYSYSYKWISKLRTRLGLKKEVIFLSQEGTKRNFKENETVFDRRQFYVKVKLANGKWMPKKRLVYEQYHNVKLSKDEVVIQLDGNPYNFDIDNLLAIKQEEHTYIAGFKGYGINKETTMALLEIARANKIINELKKGNNTDENHNIR